MKLKRSDQIAESLEQLVFQGKYEDGERLDEIKLAEILESYPRQGRPDGPQPVSWETATAEVDEEGRFLVTIKSPGEETVIILQTTGGDAEKFLGDLVTGDVAGIPDGEACYAGLLTPQGKVLFDFILFRRDGGFLIDVPESSAGEMVKRLSFYRLRAKVGRRPRSSARAKTTGARSALLVRPLSNSV